MTEAGVKTFEDHELVKVALKGDERAFSELMSRHKEKAMQLAYLKVGNYEDAKDVAQEAFVKAYRGLKSFKRESQFSTWMYRIVLNAANDFLRKSKNRKSAAFKSEEDKQNFLESKLPSLASPHDRAEAVETLNRIEAFAKNLSEKQRMVFVLRYFEDMKLKNIAQVMKISEGAVKASLHFATSKFKKEMRGDIYG